MVTISPTLRDQIERRARRAWRHRDNKQKFHRIRKVTEDELEYRVPYSPDYYGSEWVKVVQKDDGTVIVDPPTTGLIDLLLRSDIDRIKKHADIFHAYVRVKPNGKDLTVGLTVVTQYQVMDLETVKQDVKAEDRVYRIEAHADAVVKVNYGNIEVSGFQVRDELDPEKDLGFTTGLIDCRTKADVVALRGKLKKHLGKIRAYKHVTAKLESPTNSTKIKYAVGEEVEVKDAVTNESQDCAAGINVADVDWCKKSMSSGHRALAFEFEAKDVAAIPTSTDGKFRLHRALCVEEVDVKDFQPLKLLPGPAPKKKGLMEKIFGGKDEEEEDPEE